MLNLINISTLDEAKFFINWCCNDAGIRFHPDNDFEDYVSENKYSHFQ